MDTIQLLHKPQDGLPSSAQGSAPPPQIADIIVSYLEQISVDFVFGVPGGAIEPLYNALARSSRRGGPRPIVARHEAGAAFMADGYARETGKIGVCCGTSGPGTTNLITGVACAYENNIPMLVLTGQPSLPSFGKRALQESTCTGVNTLAMFHHCTRYNSLVSHPEQLESKLTTALQRAMCAPRGPAHLTLPLDILKSPSPVLTPSYDLTGKVRPKALVDWEAIERLHELTEKAENIRLVIGGWCGESVSAILQFAMLRSIPFVTTPDGKGLVNPRHPLFRGVFGFAGHAAARKCLEESGVDLILAIGTSMNEWTSNGWSRAILNEKLVHIDESPEHLARTPMARLHVRGRILTIFDQLTRLAHRSLEEGLQSAPAMRPRKPEAVLAAPDKDKFRSDATPITPQRLMHDLGNRFPPNTRFLADAGNSVAWSVHYLHPADRRLRHRISKNRMPAGGAGAPHEAGGWLRLTMDFAPMGWAIGGAVGTAAGNRGNPVVCITGDGSMLMNGQEISVAVAEGLTVIFVVLNDQALGMVKHGQRLAKAEQVGFQLPPTDFAALARALGADGHTVRSPGDMAALDIGAMCRKKGPSLIDVHIDGEEVPPINLRMQILGTHP